MKGVIIVNPYQVDGGNSHQAKRLEEEFALLGVSVKTISDGYKLNRLIDDKLSFFEEKPDFAIFLDKDKYLSASLEKLGIKLFNSDKSIRLCDDKGETVLALAGANVKMPNTLFAPLCYNPKTEYTKEDASFIAKTLSFPVIVKESYGSLGQGVYKADTIEELVVLMNKLKSVPHIYQEYIGFKAGTDVRVILVGGKVICAMQRENKGDFRSNLACGGTGTAITLDDEFTSTAETCARVLGLDYCGVDLLYSETGAVVCEVNSNAFFRGVESVTGVNVAKIYAEYIIKKLKV